MIIIHDKIVYFYFLSLWELFISNLIREEILLVLAACSNLITAALINTHNLSRSNYVSVIRYDAKFQQKNNAMMKKIPVERQDKDYKIKNCSPQTCHSLACCHFGPHI